MSEYIIDMYVFTNAAVLFSRHTYNKHTHTQTCTHTAFLYEGTAEIALQDLTDLTEYTEKKKKWQSGVSFSVEQVNGCTSTISMPSLHYCL